MTTVDFYDKEQTDDLLDTKADKTDTYTKAQVNTALESKANSSDVYTKAQVDTALSGKVDNETLNDYATKSYVDGKRTLTNLTTANFLTKLSSMKKGDEIVFNYVHFTDKDSLIQGGHLVCAENGSRWLGNVTIGQTGVQSSAPRPVAYNLTLSGNTIGLTYQASYGSYGTQITIDATTIDNINYAFVVNYT